MKANIKTLETKACFYNAVRTILYEKGKVALTPSNEVEKAKLFDQILEQYKDNYWKLSGARTIRKNRRKLLEKRKKAYEISPTKSMAKKLGLIKRPKINLVVK